MATLAELTKREVPLPHVRFERRVLEDVQASRTAGHYVGKDVDFAITTSFGGGSDVAHEVPDWLTGLERKVTLNQLTPEQAEKYKQKYDFWKKGQEIPLDGIPIKGWAVISPAQQETLIRLQVLTVEELAAANDEVKRQIGMGALDLQRKAQAWLAQAQDKGPLTQEVAALKQENDVLKGSISTLSRQVQELMDLLKTQARMAQAPSVLNDQITAADILEATPPTPAPAIPKRPRGNPNWKRKIGNHD